jgi:DNA-binding protein Fis
MPIQAEDISFPSGKKSDLSSRGNVEHTVQEWIKDMFQTKPDNLFEACVDQFSALVIKEALKLTKGNRSQAAKILGLSRPTLHSKMEKLGITVQSTVNGG